jgi:hypothetical protein
MIHSCGASGLGLWDQVSCYCERNLDPGFWAEPLNALSNLAFFIAAVMAWADLRARGPRPGDARLVGLILLIMAVGTGSFLFHTFATRWALLADVIPIGLFTLAFLALALNSILGVSGIYAVFIATAVAVFAQVLPPWFNGSFGYAPAWAALILVGLPAFARNEAAGAWILAAAAVFTLSLIFRTLDGGAGCFAHPPGVADAQFIIGTHTLWHILNAVTLYLLMRAVIGHESEPDRS